MDPITSVGIVGGGQLAVMMAEAARGLDLEVMALARRDDDPVLRRVPGSFVGDARDIDELRRLARHCDVITFDHELIDHRVIAQLEAEGITFRPGSTALAIATDKLRQSGLFEALELRQPQTILAGDVDSALDVIDRFHGSAVLKTATGGYDGRGVLLDMSEDSVRAWFPPVPAQVLVQRAIDVEHELAVQVVRGVDGSVVTYAPVRTVQTDGMCSLVQVPSGLGSAIELEAVLVARTIADVIDVVGILTVEFFVTSGELVVNELAARPHNSGHLTIEGARTSQFENHLRAVAGLGLAPSGRVVPAAAMVNLVGDVTIDNGHDGPIPGAFVHHYGKTPRPGRKVGHVTAVADTIDAAVELARRTARRLQQEPVLS